MIPKWRMSDRAGRAITVARMRLGVRPSGDTAMRRAAASSAMPMRIAARPGRQDAGGAAGWKPALLGSALLESALLKSAMLESALLASASLASAALESIRINAARGRANN